MMEQLIMMDAPSVRPQRITVVSPFYPTAGIDLVRTIWTPAMADLYKAAAPTTS